MRLSSFWMVALLLSGCEHWRSERADKSCVDCHAGIEAPHAPYIAADQCTTCHGGDGSRRSKDKAHVPIPANWAEVRGPDMPPAPTGFIKDFAPDQLDALPLEYLRFINPTDVRVVAQTCGGCHPAQAESMPRSVMATNAGHYMPTLYLAGLQEDRLARYGSFPASDPNCDPDTYPGSVCEVETLTPPEGEELAAAVSSGDLDTLRGVAYDHYLAKNCNTCHQGGYNRQDSPGTYRSSGCAACHFVYDDDGTYKGEDPHIQRGTPTHAARHEITTAIPVEQCAHCHYQGGRIGLTYRGIREGGFNAANTPANAQPWNATVYTHTPGYYFLDEDTTNAVDETPPDLHYTAGMVCADCHVGSDVHGDGRIYTTSKQQLDLRCEDCHGTIDQPAQVGDSGFIETSAGRPLPQLSVDTYGQVVLTTRMDGRELVVPQVAQLLQSGGSAEMRRAMGRDELGFSHAEVVTCDTCHTSWTQQCVGCHVSLDLRLDQTDYQTGTVTPGLTRGSRSWYVLSQLLLGTAPDGRVQQVQASQQVQMAVIGAAAYGSEDGALLLGGTITTDSGDTKTVGEFRQARGHTANNGFTPFFQHTTTASPLGCEACHPTDNSEDEQARVRGVLGHGTGDFMLPAPDGSLVDGLQFLDEDGQPTTDWVHEGTGPVDPEVRARMLSTLVEPGDP